MKIWITKDVHGIYIWSKRPFLINRLMGFAAGGGLLFCGLKGTPDDILGQIMNIDQWPQKLGDILEWDTDRQTGWIWNEWD